MKFNGTLQLATKRADFNDKEYHYLVFIFEDGHMITIDDVVAELEFLVHAYHLQQEHIVTLETEK